MNPACSSVCVSTCVCNAMCTHIRTHIMICACACVCVSYGMPTLNQNTIKLFHFQWKIYDNHTYVRTHAQTTTLKKGNLNIYVKCMHGYGCCCHCLWCWFSYWCLVIVVVVIVALFVHYTYSLSLFSTQFLSNLTIPPLFNVLLYNVQFTCIYAGKCRPYFFHPPLCHLWSAILVPFRKMRRKINFIQGVSYLRFTSHTKYHIKNGLSHRFHNYLQDFFTLFDGTHLSSLQRKSSVFGIRNNSLRTVHPNICCVYHFTCPKFLLLLAFKICSHF